MSLFIIPKTSAGPVVLGQNREQVRIAAKSPVSPFRKTPDSTGLTDAFDELGFHVFYDPNDRCVAVELWEESDPVFDDVHFFSMSPKEAALWLSQLDSDMSSDSVSATSNKLGISLYSEAGINSDNAILDSVLVFSDDYF